MGRQLVQLLEYMFIMVFGAWVSVLLREISSDKWHTQQHDHCLLDTVCAKLAHVYS